MKSATMLATATWKRIPHVAKVAFFATLIVGMLAHLPCVANHFVNDDSISYCVQEGIPVLGQGRWLLETVARMNGRTLSPSVSATLSIVLIALAAVATVSALRIKRDVYAALVGALMALTPSICCTFAFQRGAPFFTALLFSAVSVWFAVKERVWHAIAAVLFLTLSLGIYQAYIGFAAGMFLLLLMVAALAGEEPAGRIFKRGLRYLLILLLSVGLYYAILRVLLFARNETLAGYRGMDAIGSIATIDLSGLTGIVWRAFTKVCRFFMHDAYGTGFAVTQWTYRAVLLLSALAALLLAAKNKLNRKPGTLILFFVCVLLFPFAIHAIAILGLNADSGWRMIYPFVLVFVFLLKAADMLEDCASLPADADAAGRAGSRLPGLAAPIGILAVIAALAVGYQWYLITNQCYEKMRIAYEHAYAASVELNTDINRYPGFDKSTTQVAFVGDDFPELYACRNTVYDYLNHFDGIESSEMITRVSRVYVFMESFLGVDFDPFWFGDPYEKVDWSAFYDARALETLDRMPIYPRDGSMRMIDGVLVVKMSELVCD